MSYNLFLDFGLGWCLRFQVIRSVTFCAITDLLPWRQTLEIAIDVYVDYMKTRKALRLTGMPE